MFPRYRDMALRNLGDVASERGYCEDLGRVESERRSRAVMSEFEGSKVGQ